MDRVIDKNILNEWTKGKRSPEKELVFLTDIANKTAKKVLCGRPVSRKVRLAVSLAIGVDEEILFPAREADVAA